MSTTLFFHSELDAQLVADQLYNVERINNTLLCKQFDTQAINLAINLTGVSKPIIEGEKCNLKYPRDERECTDDNIPKIYVACLSAYNCGFHHGLWIDATQDPEDIQDDINWMLSWSLVRNDEACEEWAIHDYEGFYSFSLEEYEDITYVSALAQALNNANDASAMAAWLNYAKDPISDPDIEKLAEEFHSYYCGQWDSRVDFVLKSDEIEEIFNWQEFEKQFKFWSSHIDWESVARESFIQGYDSVEASPGIYVFREYHG